MDLTLLYRQHAQCVIGLATMGSDGRESIGTAFHIGDGFFLTARHVVEGRRISDVVIPHLARMTQIYSASFPEDESLDLAILSTDFDLSYYMSDKYRIVGEGWPKGEAFQLGDHLDDWIDNGLILIPVLMMGFPPIPTSRGPVMLAVTGEVNAILDRYTDSHVYFVVSSTARGGFSGGPVLHAGGVLLGIVTESLHREPELGEPGFAVALSVEPIIYFMASLGIAPRANRPLCYLTFESSLFDSLLSPHERAVFDHWAANLSSADEPSSLGRPSPPIKSGDAIWTAPKSSPLRF